MVVAPNYMSLNNDDGWLKWADKYGVDISISTTYSQLIGGKSKKSKTRKVKHPWLIPNNDKKKWKASAEFEKICGKGLFIIFDEFHKTKNQSITHYACASLVRAAKKYRRNSRVALLSFTPGDKPDHYPQILRMTGLTTSVNLYRHIPFTSDYEWQNYGFGELSKLIKKIDKGDEARMKIEDAMEKISASRASKICKELYDTYIRSIITFAMEKPKNNIRKIMVNAFLETDNTSLDIINNGIAMLGNAVNWDGNDVGEQREWSLSGITNGLKRIEQGKLLSIVRYVMNESKKRPDKKFVICCGARDTKNHYFLQKLIYKDFSTDKIKDTLNDLRKTHPHWKHLNKDMVNLLCNKYLNNKIHPNILNGKVSKKERVEIVRKFQENNNKSWCLIMSPGVGAESISLHDKHGGYPHDILIIPDYYFGRVIQAAGRVYRVGVKSDVKIMMIYSRNAIMETNILNSMIRKTKIAKELLAEGQGQNVIFPGEYPFQIYGKKNYKYDLLKGELDDLKRRA